MPEISAKKILKNIFILTVPSIIIALLLLELLVRITWDKKQGTPGLVLTHPTRIETLAPNFNGYFAGQPLRVNNLGFRDERDYDIKKPPHTFRIILLGDSVTFGHGAKFNETWPYMLQKHLEEWNGRINWQVWNLGVPGYDNVLELRTLEELGPKFKPDLVVVGFYENDLFAWNYHYKQKLPTWVYNLKRFFKSHFYLYTKLRYVYNVLRNLKAGPEYQSEREAFFLKKPAQEIAPVDLSKFELKHNLAGAPVPPKTDRVYSRFTDDSIVSLKESLAKFKEYNDKGVYRIVYFINIAPDIDSENDRYIDGIHNEINNFFIKLMKDFPTVSSYDAFWSYKPSEVPDAGTHSLATSNKVKADVLFNFLKNGVLKEEGAL